MRTLLPCCTLPHSSFALLTDALLNLYCEAGWHASQAPWLNMALSKLMIRMHVSIWVQAQRVARQYLLLGYLHAIAGQCWSLVVTVTQATA